MKFSICKVEVLLNFRFVNSKPANVLIVINKIRILSVKGFREM